MVGGETPGDLRDLSFGEVPPSLLHHLGRHLYVTAGQAQCGVGEREGCTVAWREELAPCVGT
jgi:hypothetical protein